MRENKLQTNKKLNKMINRIESYLNISENKPKHRKEEKHS